MEDARPPLLAPAPTVRAAAVAILGNSGMTTNSDPDIATVDITGKRLAFVRACDVQMESVQWVWSGYIPKAKLSVIEGRMGVGKTTLLTTVAAAVTTVGPLPGQATTMCGPVLVISLEDDMRDTLTPRLVAAHADLTKVHLYNGYEFAGRPVGGGFNLAEDCERLRLAVAETGAVLVILDPLTAMLGKTVNSFRDQDVRGVLAPLAQVAQATGAAIVFTRHFRKGGGAAEDAGGGSVGIGAACRSVLRVDRDPEDADRYLLSSVKSSLSRPPVTLGYRLEEALIQSNDPSKPIITSRTRWDGESAWTAQSLASHAAEEGDRSRATEAQDWLREALADGPKLAQDVLRAAGNEGIARRTLQRASDALHVVKERRGFGQGSLWSLPPLIGAMDVASVPTTELAPMGVNGANATPSSDAGARMRRIL